VSDPTTPAPPGASASEPAGIEAARLELRHAGYCVQCNRIVERDQWGACANGHPAEAVTGRIMLTAEEPLPVLPRFNLAAFLIPPVWGPAHGQWAGAFFLPIWLFADSTVVSSLDSGLGPKLVAVAVVVATLAAQLWFASRANGLAWRRVCDHTSIPEFLARQRVWAIAAIPAALLLIGWALWFDVVYRPAHPLPTSS